MNPIEQLATLWSIAKQREDEARDDRVAIEARILELHPAKEEGSETFTTPMGVKLTLTGKVTYKADLDKLTALTGSWPDDLRPIKTETKPDESKLKLIRAERPDLWKAIAPAVETKAAKTGVIIKWRE